MSGELLTRVVFAWEPLLSERGLFLALGVAILVLALSWRGSSGIATRKRAALLALRALALLGMALVVAGPARVTTEDRPVREPVVVLIDASRSMRVEDVGGESRATAVGRWLREVGPSLDELRERYDLRFFLFDDALRPWSGGGGDEDGASLDEDGDGRADSAAAGGGGPGTGDPSPSDGAGTDIGGALFGVREQLDGRRPAGLLLVSDGADRSALGRAAEDDERADARIGDLLGELGYPVSTFIVGDEAGAGDLAVRAVAAPPFGFVRRPLTISADQAQRFGRAVTE